MRNNLIRLAIKYQGNYFKLVKALKNQEIADSSISLQRAVTIMDEYYPASLLDLRYPPLVLFYRGDPKLLNRRKVAVVGSRITNEYGENVTRKIVNKLNEKNFVIVSGLAKGIDAVAAKSANRTIAVLGNGIDYHYPKENDLLYEILGNNQLIISEYPLGVRPEKYHFPFRNRIIAALGEAVFVTQAKSKSGTMLTVNEALTLNRDVYAVPYPLDEPLGEGCNSLICQGANMVLYDFEKKDIDIFI